MRSTVRLLLLLMIMVVVLSGANELPPMSGTATSPERALQQNQRLLEDWSADPVHRAKLQHNLETFWQLSKTERDKIRQLDRDLAQLAPDRRKQLFEVMDRYYAWVQQLNDSQRQRLSQARTNDEKIQVIRAIRLEQWVSRLPKRTRESLATLSDEERVKAIAQLKSEEKEWKQNWWVQFRPTRLEELPRDVQQYARETLMPLLPPKEREELEAAQEQAWPAYVRLLYQKAQHVQAKLPGPIGPSYVDDLPRPIQELINKRPFKMQQLREAEGNWPEFAMRLKEALPSRLAARFIAKRYTPTKPEAFSKTVQKFLEKELYPKLTTREKDQLKKSEGVWPRYPIALQQLTKKYRLQIPGTYLPRTRELWKRVKGEINQK